MCFCGSHPEYGSPAKDSISRNSTARSRLAMSWIAETGFPGASVGPRELLRTVEGLLWLITRTVEGFDQMFVHHLNDTSFRVPRFIY